MEIRLIELLDEIKTLILGKVNERWLTLKEVSDYASISESTALIINQKKPENALALTVQFTLIVLGVDHLNR